MPVPPVLIIGFNRPKHIQQVFNAIKQAKPNRLYIAVDGPRKDRKADLINVQETINIFENIDWPCNVKRLIRKENLGCKMAVSSAITWFFEHEEQGIILEDDCLPSSSFFNYCEYLLDKYKYNDSIMHINGVNFQDGIVRGTGSYYFSKICHVWGWATWRRAWEKYDIEMKEVETFFEYNIYKSVINYPNSLKYWQSAFYKTKQGLIDTWDYQWVYSVWKNNGLAIASNYNLVSNIGFDEMATHTKDIDLNVSGKALESIKGEVQDCSIYIPHYDADIYSCNKLFTVRKKNLFVRFRNKIKSEILKINSYYNSN
ncbi:nucleotide-diphospho-sugar transferase [Adhaeribacter swui]|uniref:Nucleotide-diphospho-sugar transferase n=1 Tax=Adhaeribacter swui TaxID=2086471 RepID=A0A7G7G599_9BACT|nr:nucleotide-diphospho-sugar transferase [Adhaeribacter swui]QNF32333.1 nucleotide-diphospho-sugar transferase [Adhaeribacter swui]